MLIYVFTKKFPYYFTTSLKKKEEKIYKFQNYVRKYDCRQGTILRISKSMVGRTSGLNQPLQAGMLPPIFRKLQLRRYIYQLISDSVETSLKYTTLHMELFNTTIQQDYLNLNMQFQQVKLLYIMRRTTLQASVTL